MRLLFVVQRYGLEVAGGSELHCREYAEHLAGRGHDVEVVTSCAQSYVDWANVYPPGASELRGVVVNRLAVSHPRDDRLFGPLNGRVVWGIKPVAPYLQREWMRMQGPDLPQLVPWLRANVERFDAAIFITYLYATTWAGLPAAAGLIPTLMHPTAHDEPAIHLPLFDSIFRLPRAFAFLTEEEAELVRSRFRSHRPSAVVGVGIDIGPATDATAFRTQYGLEDRPYLVFVGRVDPGKGSDELFDFFVAYKTRNPGPLALVVVGEQVRPLPGHPDVIKTGFVDEATKAAALSGALALVQPSYFESFSIVLTEAWAQGIPALVQAHCEVLVGQARRSGGAVPYAGFAEFEAAVELLTENRDLARALGAAGKRYVEQRYSWPKVLDAYESLLARTIRGGECPPPRFAATLASTPE